MKMDNKKKEKTFQVEIARLQWSKSAKYYNWIARSVCLSEKQFEKFYRDLKPEWQKKLKKLKKRVK